MLALATSIVIDQLVPGDSDHPRHRLELGTAGVNCRNDGREGLLGQIFGERSIPENRPAQVAVHLSERPVVELGDGVGRQMLPITRSCIPIHACTS